MYSDNGVVRFTENDMHFVKKHGLLAASELFLARLSSTGLPLIDDTFQLAGLLHAERKLLFRMCRNIPALYDCVTVPKKSGGKRLLNVPCQLLRNVQTIILREIVEKLPVSEHAKAYKKGATLKDNASPHVGKRYLLKLDITDFFPSITFLQVYSVAFNSGLFPAQVGAMLTTLCCYGDALPQGAPTSPALSNLVLRAFDDNLGKWCKARGIVYTRYCDDLTFSSDEPMTGLYPKVEGMLLNMGFEINRRKTRLVCRDSRQTVTGITVNEKLSIPRDYKRSLRSELYYSFKFGPTDALLHVKDKARYIQNGTAAPLKYLDSLEGKVRFVLSVEPENAYFREALTKLHTLRAECDDLAGDYMPFFSGTSGK